MAMKKGTWLIIASLATLASVPMMYIGFTNGAQALAHVGTVIFIIGMMIAPTMKLLGKE